MIDCLPDIHFQRPGFVIVKFLVFPAMADEDILQKGHRGLKMGGGNMKPSNQIHENITDLQHMQ